MLTTKKCEPLFLTVPSLGDCTLLPFDILPENFRRYEKIFITGDGLDLKEFHDLSRSEVQEIFKALAFKLSERGVETSESISVLLSGSHDVYPNIDITDKNKAKEKCITAMQFFFWQNAQLSDKGELIGGPVDMQLDEVPVGEFIPIIGDDSTYCLFLGKIE